MKASKILEKHSKILQYFCGAFKPNKSRTLFTLSGMPVSLSYIKGVLEKREIFPIFFWTVPL